MASVSQACMVQCATLRGVEAVPVAVEVVISVGIPSFSVVGMADAAIHESRERVRAAIRAAGYAMPADKVVVNLAPGDLKKTGSGFDLPIAIAILAATGQIDFAPFRDALVVGELSLDASVREVRGLLAYQMTAKREGLRLVTGAVTGRYFSVPGVECLILPNLGRARIAAFDEPPHEAPVESTEALDFSCVQGHALAKRALLIAAAGEHGVLMVGPPGSGKTLLARCLPSILPPLSLDDALGAALVHSVAGESCDSLLAGIRPFRAPHHSATSAGLVGGGSPIRPGEISLAHQGVLFLDELAEFKPSVLQELRQPLEAGSITITRADGSYVFPSRFMLVAAMNPCPCGYFGDQEHSCSCSEGQVRQYRSRVGGPLFDRIDIRIDVWRVEPQALMAASDGESSASMRAKVLAARERRASRTVRSDDSLKACLAACRMDEEAHGFFESMVKAQAMSARSALRTLRVARTIADLDGRAGVNAEEVAEACGLRFNSEVG